MEPLILGPYLEDISCSGLGEMYLEHKIFKSLKTNIAFGSMEELDTFVIQLSEKIGKPVTYRNPIVDATLPGWLPHQPGIRRRRLQTGQQFHHSKVFSRTVEHDSVGGVRRADL